MAKWAFHQAPFYFITVKQTLKLSSTLDSLLSYLRNIMPEMVYCCEVVNYL